MSEVKLSTMSKEEFEALLEEARRLGTRHVDALKAQLLRQLDGDAEKMKKFLEA